MRSVIVVLLACATAILLATPGRAQPAPDLDRARTLYAAAEQALAEARIEDALRDYKASYEASRDPALFYKIGVAYQKGNVCQFAVSYFVAYLKYGKPSPDFFALTREKIRTCGLDPDALPPDLPDPTAGTGSGSAAVGSANTVVVPAGSGSDAGSGSAVVAVGSGAGSGSGIAPKPARANHRAAWILVGGAIAAATVGAVLAYSSKAAESDVDDLYVGLGGAPPVFDAATQQRFDDLVAEGKRYQTLSFISFGAAVVLGGLAAWRFVVDEKPVQITPTASPTGVGVTAGFRF